MPHGDFSDVSAVIGIIIGSLYLFFPQVAFNKFGPLEATFDGTSTPALITGIRTIGAFIVGWSMVLSVNRWNPINGKPGALLCLNIAVALIYSQLVTLDSLEFKLRPLYLIAALYVLTAVHLAFNANPFLTWQELKAAEEKEAAKKAEAKKAK